MDSVIFQRVKDLCIENNITIANLEVALGMGRASINKWRHTQSPTIDKISKVANYFNVSIDYLVGASDCRSTVDNILKDPDYIALQRARERMSDKDKTRMMSILKTGFEYAFADENETESVF